MENSRLFVAQAERPVGGEFYAFVSGERHGTHGAPARVAWEIERWATARGWPVGESLGSEAALRQRLQVSRETLREAIRIVESRGAMKMRRGRSGGLMLLCPPAQRTAASLAAYLRAIGIGSDAFAQCVRGLDQLLAWQLSRRTSPLPPREPRESPRDWLVRASGRQTYRIYASVLDQLAPSGRVLQHLPPLGFEEAFAGRDAKAMFALLAPLPFVPAADWRAGQSRATPVRAGAIAVAMIEQAEASGSQDLGNEGALCDRFEASRSLVRQALRILQDLDMVEVRLGRGGGYRLKQPSPIGVIRQMFAWLAARNCDPYALNELMWDLNAANVRLAGERLAAMPDALRSAHCDRIGEMLDEAPWHERFIHLQQELARIANCPMVDTLARCIVSYQARAYGDLPLIDEPDRGLAAMERMVLALLRSADVDRAEDTLRALQDRAEELILENLGLRAAAE